MKRATMRLLLAAVGLYVTGISLAADPPQPYGALPSARQRAWQDLEFYGFLHFTVNTFTDKEWGYGDEPESIFNPSAFDADQIVGAAQQAGMKGLILTAKHHDGFCLWPSKYTEHSVKNSPWKGGQGDVVREISDACRRHGLKFGVYLSPWDRNHKDYGRPEYVTYFRNQLRELLTQYGPIYEVWFDGANGGDGYYGGARERREIDRKTYYGWQETWALVRQLQPDAVMFSDVGPEVRWVGNEAGIAGDPCWATLNLGAWCPGFADRHQLNSGHADGSHWIPAECDVSIRPGWFYHASQDSLVRTPQNVVQLYYVSVGRGASLLLNLPPDRRGLIHENDVATLKAMRRHLDATFATDLARAARLNASHVRGGDPRFGPAKLVDGDKSTYWATDDAATAAEVVLDLDRPTCFNVVRLREAVTLGQRVRRFALDAWQDGRWQEFSTAESIGIQRLVRGKPITSDKVRLRILAAAACPAIAELGLFLEPTILDAPTISRDRSGLVTLATLSATTEVRYTLDGSEPNSQSAVYESPFPLPQGGSVRARLFAAESKQPGPVASAAFGVAKGKWRAKSQAPLPPGPVARPGGTELPTGTGAGTKNPPQNPPGQVARPGGTELPTGTGAGTKSGGAAPRGNEPSRAIDDNPSTYWLGVAAEGVENQPAQLVVDMKDPVAIRAFTYLPRQDRDSAGMVDRYAFFVSDDGKTWGTAVAEGEFANIQSNPILQTVTLAKPVIARFFMFVARHTVDRGAPTAAEVGVLASD